VRCIDCSPIGTLDTRRGRAIGRWPPSRPTRRWPPSSTVRRRSLLNLHPGATFRARINADQSQVTFSQQGIPGTARYTVRLVRYTKWGVKPIDVSPIRLTGLRSVTEDL
jgi:hypothetical protein